MRTRSDAARQRSLLKLPEDCIRHVALFIDCDVDAARLALTSRRVMRSMTPTVWAQILKASHGGLKIAAAETDGLRCAARLAAARNDQGSVDGFFALATNCGAAPYGQQVFWADALFRREPWRIYCSRPNPGGAPVLCAAAFLAGGDDEGKYERRYMLDELELLRSRVQSHGNYTGFQSLGSVFLETFTSDRFYGFWLSSSAERTRQICESFEAAGCWEDENWAVRSGLSRTVYEARGDGIEVDPRVEALAARAHPATAIATGVTIRRAMHFTCPARCGIIYGLRRQPRVADISDGRLKELAAAAAPAIREIMADDDASVDSVAELADVFGDAAPVRLQVSTLQGRCYQLLDEDEDEALPGEVFPLAIFCFAATYGDFEDMRDLRADLAVPVAIQGMVVAVVETDDYSDGEANVDLEYVGIEGYAYVPPDHGS